MTKQSPWSLKLVRIDARASGSDPALAVAQNLAKPLEQEPASRIRILPLPNPRLCRVVYPMTQAWPNLCPKVTKRRGWSACLNQLRHVKQVQPTFSFFLLLVLPQFDRSSSRLQLSNSLTDCPIVYRDCPLSLL